MDCSATPPRAATSALDSATRYFQRVVIYAVARRITNITWLATDMLQWTCDTGELEAAMAGKLVLHTGAQSRLGLVADGTRSCVSVRSRVDSKRAVHH